MMDAKTLRIRLGQRFGIGFDGLTIPDEYVRLIREYKVGNVILFKRNVGSYEQLRKLCADLTALVRQETGLDPFIMIDEECGSVSRLAHIGVPTPCAMAIGATGDPQNAYSIGRIAGEELRAVGINLDLAPVLDCFTNPDNTVCGNRCFASDPEKVSRFGIAYIHGLQEAGVIACGKHFPGHGDTAVDSHLSLPTVNKPLEVMEKNELVPFSAAIEAGVESIMSAHVVFPAIEPNAPGTVSRQVLTGLLREKMGFDGLILSDGMEMKAVYDLYGIPGGSLRALNAGVDIALICHSAEEAEKTMNRLEKAYEDGDLAEKNVIDHYQRILKYKSKLAAGDVREPAFATEAQFAEAQRIMEASISLLNAPDGQHLPRIAADTAVFGTRGRRNSLANDENALHAASMVAEALGARYIEELPAEFPPTALVLMDPSPDVQRVKEMAERLLAAGTKVNAVSLFTPRCLDLLPDNVWKIAAWQYDELALRALIQWIREHVSA